MPIKWSALKVSEATDMIEQYVNQAAEPLEQIRIVVREARKIENLPQYVEQYLLGIEDEIDRAIGGSRWGAVGRLKAEIHSIRKALPHGAIEEERKRLESGRMLRLVT